MTAIASLVTSPVIASTAVQTVAVDIRVLTSVSPSISVGVGRRLCGAVNMCATYTLVPRGRGRWHPVNSFDAFEQGSERTRKERHRGRLGTRILPVFIFFRPLLTTAMITTSTIAVLLVDMTLVRDARPRSIGAISIGAHTIAGDSDRREDALGLVVETLKAL